MVVAGGLAALSWEVIWQLQASLAFGVSAAGTALTLAATMAGMTVGALAAGGVVAQWGLARGLPDRNLSDEEIRRGILLDPEGLARYASADTLITDDNQLLQFSQLRGGLRGQRSLRLMRENLAILSDVAGRRPFTRRISSGTGAPRR